MVIEKNVVIIFFLITESPVAKMITRLNFFLDILLRDRLNLIVTLTKVELQKIYSQKNNIGYYKVLWCYNFNHMLQI